MAVVTANGSSDDGRYTTSFPIAPAEHVEMKATAMGPLDVHVASAELPAKAESLQVVWFDLDPEVAGSSAMALQATCHAFGTVPMFDVASIPVWLPALEGLHAVGERPVAQLTSTPLERGGLKGCDLHLLAGTVRVRARVIGSGFRMYELVVSSDRDEPAAADVSAFFDAFHAAAPPAPSRRAVTPVRHHGAFTAVVAGAVHSCALDADAAPWCWGNDHNGQLGSDADADVPRPLDEGAHVRLLAAGGGQTCAVLANETLRCWGSMAGGPARVWDVVGLPGAVRSIGVGGFFDCVSLADGAVWCWGGNALGQLGVPATHEASTPPVRVPLSGAAAEVSAGTFAACARMQDGSVACWGSNREGQVGRDADGVFGPGRVPLAGSAAQVGAGTSLSCARLADGSVWCWGEIGVTTERSPPTKLALPAAAVQIAVGNQFACARLGDGSIWCWGSNVDGQLATDDPCDAYPRPRSCEIAAPRRIALPAPATVLAVGDTHACAILRDDRAWCWGDGGSGQLGRGAKAERMKPAPTK